MPLLDAITVAEATPIMAEAFGLCPTLEKPEAIKYLNKYRNLLFTRYNKYHLFDNVFHRLCVTDFGCYSGFTLPEDVVSVEAAWDYGRPLTLHSRWRETHTGLGHENCKRVSVIEMAELFPTERDICGATALKVFAEREDDEGKIVRIEVIDEDGNSNQLSFTLVGEGWAVSDVIAKKIVSVVLPTGLEGSITLATRPEGYVLSQYKPWETIPSYRRFKMNDSGCCKTVLIQGVKRFKKVYLEHDIIEVGDALVIEAAGQYFKFGDNAVDSNQLAVANMWLTKMEGFIDGLIARHRGGAIQDGTPPFGRKIRKKSLPGYT